MNEVRISIVNPKVSDEEVKRILSEIERIAIEIAEEVDEHGVCYMDVI